MLGRQVGTSLLRLPRVARLPFRPLQCHRLDPALAPRLALISQRFYAEVTTRRPSRPKKAVGEPSRPVKRDVKRAAKSPKEDAATKKVKARAQTAQKKTKAAQKAGAKPKKVLSDEQRAAQAEKKAKRKASEAKKLQQANLVELKKAALDPPPLRRLSAWQMFVFDRVHLQELQGTARQDLPAKFGGKMTDAAAEWHNVTPAEREHYNHVLHTTKEAEQAAYKSFIESHTVEQIETANAARRRLRNMHKDQPTKAKKWPAIKDERAVKRPAGIFTQFNANRWASGDFKNIKLGEASKLIAQEWRELAEDEKRKYNNLYKQDAVRYKEEYSGVHGHAPFVADSPAQAAAAAA